MSDTGQTQWESTPADPDPKQDLGYAGIKWDVIQTERRQQSHLLFLPRDEELLGQEAFVIATESSVVSTVEYR